MVEYACGNDRVIAGEGADHVLDTLALPDPELVRLQVDRVAAKLRRRQLHRIAGPGARLLEIERDALSAQGGPAALLGQGEGRPQVTGRQVANGE